MCIQYTLDEFSLLIFLLLNTYFDDPSAVIERAYERARQSMLSTEEYVIGDPEEDGDDGDESDTAAAGHANDVVSSAKMKSGIPLLSTRRSGLLSNFVRVGKFGQQDLHVIVSVCLCL
jgi:hypothetical protein